MQKIKTANFILIIATLIIVVGFILVLTRKQSVDAATGQVKSFWKQPADVPAKTTA